jgi:hypothetical protein
VGVSGMQSEAALEEDSRIHASEDGHVPLGLDGQVSQVEVLHKVLVGLQQLVGD